MSARASQLPRLFSLCAGRYQRPTGLKQFTRTEESTMRIDRRWCLPITGTLLFVGGGITARADDGITVRWDIVHLAFTSPLTVSEGGNAFATTRNPNSLKIELTGSGTFKPGESDEVTGGGTWMTYSGCPGACVATGSGTYRVTRLASWEFDDLQLLVLN